jgi:hypothetical protein
MTNLSAAYDRLARPWTHQQLGDRYREAERRGRQLPECEESDQIQRPVAMLATALPACAALSVAIHVIHVLPDPAYTGSRTSCYATRRRTRRVALHRCHQALELDSRAHRYTAAEWLPAVYDVAAPLLESARLNRDPPGVVALAQAAVHWVSHAIAELDQDAPDATAAIVDGLGRILALDVFVDVSQAPTDEPVA